MSAIPEGPRRIRDVRRTLTKTPLARAHERRVAGGSSHRPKPIPWGALDRTGFPERAIELAVDSYVHLAAGEYGAVQVYGRLTAALALAGVPFDLITASAGIGADEARHADGAMTMAGRLAGADVTVPVDAEALEAPWKGEVGLEDLDRVILHVAAISETLACALMEACLERTTHPTVRALLGNLLADEVCHARFGWHYIAWRAPQWTGAERQRLADSMANNVANIERYWQGRDAAGEVEQQAARQLGVLGSEDQREAVRAVMEEQVVPALDGLGLGGSHAWRVRARGGGAG
jgi:hypothetical protein